MINHFFDEIFLINTKEAKDRLKKVTKELNYYDINFNRIEALSCEEEFKSKKDNDFLGWNKNALSLVKTTQEILKISINNNYKNILIFEDDVKINSDHIYELPNILENFFSKIKNFDFLHLAYSDVSKYSFSIVNYVNKIPLGCFRCQAYIINSNIFEEYLTELEKENKPIDWVTKKLHIKNKKSYVVSKKPFYQKPNEYSYIREKIVDY